jgi:hypothetical protein
MYDHLRNPDSLFDDLYDDDDDTVGEYEDELYEDDDMDLFPLNVSDLDDDLDAYPTLGYDDSEDDFE